MEHLFFNTAYICYTASTLLYLIYLFSKHEKFSRAAWMLLSVALAVHIGSLVIRTMDARSAYTEAAQILRAHGKLDAAIGAERAARSYVPWSNWFESFSFFGAIIALIYFFIAWRIPIPVLGAFIMPVSWGLLTIAFLSDKR